MGLGSRLWAGAALAVGLAAGAAGAATLSEADVPGGAFGPRFDAPTLVGQGVTAVSGTGGQNSYDTFRFTGLPAGAQSLAFSFAAPTGYDHSYSAGGAILWSAQPFRWGWDGTQAAWVQVDYYRPTQQAVLDLPSSFGGDLWLALNFTHGANLGYNISAPSNAGPATTSVPVADPGLDPVAPVPLPATLPLLAGALGVAAALRLRRR